MKNTWQLVYEIKIQFCILDVENYFMYFSVTVFVNDSVNFFLRVKSHLKYCHFRKWTCWLLLKADKLHHLNYTLEICLYKVIWILVLWSFHWILAVEFSTSVPSLAFRIPLQHAWVMHQHLSWVGSPFISRAFFLSEFKWCSLNQDGLLLFPLGCLCIPNISWLLHAVVLMCPTSSALLLSNRFSKAPFLFGLSSSSVKTKKKKAVELLVPCHVALPADFEADEVPWQRSKKVPWAKPFWIRSIWVPMPLILTGLWKCLLVAWLD